MQINITQSQKSRPQFFLAYFYTQWQRCLHSPAQTRNLRENARHIEQNEKRSRAEGQRWAKATCSVRGSPVGWRDESVSTDFHELRREFIPRRFKDENGLGHHINETVFALTIRLTSLAQAQSRGSRAWSCGGSRQNQTSFQPSCYTGESVRVLQRPPHGLETSPSQLQQ